MKYAAFLFVFILFLSACGKTDSPVKDIVVSDDVKLTINSDTPTTSKKSEPIIENYNIVDVTEGKEVRGITTSDTKGYGKADFQNGIYSLAVIFENLPEPKNGDFYEGWIVQKEPFNFISTGKIEDKDGMQVNIFTSNKDYREHDFYVLTLEPDDGDPAPADHIIEGILEFR